MLMIVCHNLMKEYERISVIAAKSCNMTGYYECANGDCIPEAWILDVIIDCGDKSEEGSFEQSLTYLSHVFAKSFIGNIF